MQQSQISKTLWWMWRTRNCLPKKLNSSFCFPVRTKILMAQINHFLDRTIFGRLFLFLIWFYMVSTAFLGIKKYGQEGKVYQFIHSFYISFWSYKIWPWGGKSWLVLESTQNIHKTNKYKMTRRALILERVKKSCMRVYKMIMYEIY